MTEPLGMNVEGFVFADLDMDELVSIRRYADPVGYYSRSDLLRLGADTRAKKHVREKDDNGSAGRGKKAKMATGGRQGELRGVEKWVCVENGKV